MEWVETAGRSLTEAKALAVDLLGIDESEAEFIVLSEPKTGLFGRLKVKARVRARVRPVRPRAKIERRDRKPKGSGRSESRDSLSRSDKAGAADETAPSDQLATPTNRKKPRGPRSPVDPGQTQPIETVQAAETTVSGSAVRPVVPASVGVRRNDQKRAGADARRDNEMSGDHEAPGDEDGSYTMDPEAMQAEADRATAFLAGLAKSFGSKADASYRIEEDSIECSLNGNGEDLGLLIGPRGQTLQSIQELTRLVAQRGGRAAARMHIDIAEYRRKRGAALTRFAVQVATDVVASGSPKAFEPMSAADRKVVHDAISNIDGVQSSSQGEDPHRYVLISPV